MGNISKDGNPKNNKNARDTKTKKKLLTKEQRLLLDGSSILIKQKYTN